MSKEFYSRELSACEALIMKSIWAYDGDMPLQKLMDTLRENYQKDYARTTVATFLSRLTTKGYVKTYRVGRTSFSHPLIDKDEYKQKLIREQSDFWFDGDDVSLIAALGCTKKFTEEEAAQITQIISNQ